MTNIILLDLLGTNDAYVTSSTICGSIPNGCEYCVSSFNCTAPMLAMREICMKNPNRAECYKYVKMCKFHSTANMPYLCPNEITSRISNGHQFCASFILMLCIVLVRMFE